MTNNFDAEIAKKIIYDNNVNVTEPNPLKDFIQIVLNIVLVVVCVYLFIFVISGIILKNLSPEKQVVVENFISPSLSPNLKELSTEETRRLNRIKNNILSVDTKFPPTSNLDINVIKNDQLNALCYPNGHIYITSALYENLNSDEELTFVIAHEMAHYRNKDHLLNLRRSISNSAVLILISVANPKSNDLGTIANGGLKITELKFSRGVEEKADKYAVNVMNRLYGNARAGVKVMKILKEKNRFDIEFLSSHPNLDKRIKYIQKASY